MEPGPEIDWKDTAVWLGVWLTAVTLLGRLWKWPFQFIWRQFGKVGMWAGRRTTIAFLRSHPTEAREYLLGLFPDLLAAAADREQRICELEDLAVKFATELSRDRTAVAAAMQSVNESLQEMASEQREVQRVLHTLVGAYLGPKEALPAIRERMNANESGNGKDG